MLGVYGYFDKKGNAIRYDGKIIKQSIYKNKLEEIVKELNVNKCRRNILDSSSLT